MSRINLQRRGALRAGGGMGLYMALVSMGILSPHVSWAAWNQNAFGAKTLEEALTGLGVGKPQDGKDVALTVPEVAENGAVVPMILSTTLPNTTQVAILIEKNPFPLAAIFNFPEGTESSITTRCKMAQSSAVYGLVRADGNFYMTKKDVKVTLGGCGG